MQGTWHATHATATSDSLRCNPLFPWILRAMMFLIKDFLQGLHFCSNSIQSATKCWDNATFDREQDSRQKATFELHNCKTTGGSYLPPLHCIRHQHAAPAVCACCDETGFCHAKLPSYQLAEKSTHQCWPVASDNWIMKPPEKGAIIWKKIKVRNRVLAPSMFAPCHDCSHVQLYPHINNKERIIGCMP